MKPINYPFNLEEVYKQINEVIDEVIPPYEQTKYDKIMLWIENFFYQITRYSLIPIIAIPCGIGRGIREAINYFEEN